MERIWLIKEGSLFISYYPLKQGLKRRKREMKMERKMRFISYYPLKQGLKLNTRIKPLQNIFGFISYYPLKQGLKPDGIPGKSARCFHLYPTIH